MFTVRAGKCVSFYNRFKWLYLLCVRAYANSVKLCMVNTISVQSEPITEHILKCSVHLLLANACGESSIITPDIHALFNMFLVVISI